MFEPSQTDDVTCLVVVCERLGTQNGIYRNRTAGLGLPCDITLMAQKHICCLGHFMLHCLFSAWPRLSHSCELNIFSAVALRSTNSLAFDKQQQKRTQYEQMTNR